MKQCTEYCKTYCGELGFFGVCFSFQYQLHKKKIAYFLDTQSNIKTQKKNNIHK